MVREGLSLTAAVCVCLSLPLSLLRCLLESIHPSVSGISELIGKARAHKRRLKEEEASQLQAVSGGEDGDVEDAEHVTAAVLTPKAAATVVRAVSDVEEEKE